jgi:glycosyltransferase involved in cell wall biosynthesis
MNIWAFPSFYPSDKPGFRWKGIFAHRQYKGLVENGARVRVILPVLWHPPFPFSEMNKEWSQLRKSDIPLKRIQDGIEVFHPRISNFKPNRFVKKSYRERYIDSVVNFFSDNNIQLNPNIDFFFSQWLPESVVVQEAAHKLGVRSAILSIGDDVVVWPHEKKANLQELEKLMANADLRFACADYLGREVNTILHHNYPYHVVRWGVDYNFFKPVDNATKLLYRKKYNLPEKAVLILNVGSAIVRKGWLDLFDAMAAIGKDAGDFRIVAVHAGFNDLDLDKEAEKRGLKEKFINLFEIAPELLNEIFGAVDIFCLPSHWEGMANANIEAMSSGLPVITTNVCGHPELINDGENGYLIPPKQPELLAEKLIFLINNSEFRAKMGATAREFIVTRWGNFADNSKFIYRNLQQVLASNEHN